MKNGTIKKKVFSDKLELEGQCGYYQHLLHSSSGEAGGVNGKKLMDVLMIISLRMISMGQFQ